jgi:hypothetical protein
MKKTLFSVLLVAGLLIGARPAFAGLTLGVDVGPNFVLEPSGIDLDKSAGIGVAARAGYMFDAKILKISPELKFGFEDPGAPNAFRIMGGLRVNLFEGFSPVAFGHVGGLVGDIQGFAWDVGGGIDFTLIPKLNLGAFVSYNRADDSELTLGSFTSDGATWEWVQVGGAATIMF